MTKKNPAAVALGRRGGRVKSEKKAVAVRENGKKGGRPRKATIVANEYRDVDGYWIELVPGFRMSDDGTHGIVEDTKREAYSKLSLVEPCDCEECRRMSAVR